MLTLVGVGLTSPYQIVSFIAFYLANKSEYDKAIIFKSNYWGGDQVYQRYIDFFTVNGGVVYDGVYSDSCVINQLSKIKNSLGSIDLLSVDYPKITFVVRSWRLRWCKVRQLIVISDGFGYYGNLISFLTAARREGGLSKVIKKVFIYAIKFLLKSVTLNSNCKYIKEFVFFKYSNLQVIPSFVENFRFAIDVINQFTPVEIYSCKPYLLFVDQPLVKLGILSQSDYDTLIVNLATYADSQGLAFYIKRHPSSDSKVECKNNNILFFDGILEELCVKDKNLKIVISHSSTGLLNISNISPGIQVLRLANDLGIYLSPKQRKLLSQIEVLKNKGVN